MKQMRRLRKEIRRFQQMVTREVPNENFRPTSANGKVEIIEIEENYALDHLINEVSEIEDRLYIMDQLVKEMPDEDGELLMCLEDIEANKSRMNWLTAMVKSVENSNRLTEGCTENSTSLPITLVIPILPPLPDFEISQKHIQVQPGTEDSSSDSDTSSDSCPEFEQLQDLYSLEGPYWEAMNAPTKALATDEEEEDLMMGASVLLASDQKAQTMIALFDEPEASSNVFGQKSGTSREFLLNLPLMYVCRDKRCPICKIGFSSKDRSARLPCRHYFHAYCILQWLLKRTTCPMCRREFPRR
uniref:Predicted protein n=1 Tax=Hordeum vulgare subsp. vulgare TaxID=112509 RepID=F2E3Q5_HORVV|nr:predicted protein [Hordeum vulgare subsp. vulgare]